MLRLLRRISIRQLQASPGRTILIVIGIATGVAMMVAIEIINRSVVANFQQTLEAIAGPAALEVTLGLGEVGFPEDAVATVQADPDVTSAVPLVRGTVALADTPSETLQLFGADLASEEDLDRYRVSLTTDRRTVLATLNEPRWVALTAAYAEVQGVSIGQTFRLATPRGVEELTVRGLLEVEGLGRAFGGRFALMDLPAAQMLLGKEGRLDQIDVILRPEADVDAVRARLLRALPAELAVERPVARGEVYERVLSSFQWMLTGLSLLCLVAGIYIIYNTTSTGAVHRAVAFTGLRLIGASSGQLFRLLMVEALLLGIVGSALGVPAGIGLARLLTGMVADSMGVIFQLRFPVESLALDVSHLTLTGIVGALAALVASYFAARRVTTLDCLEVLRKDIRELAPRPPMLRLVRWWAILVAVSAVALVLEVRYRSIAWGNFGSTLWFASSIVIAVPIVSVCATILSHVLVRLASAPGRIAADSLFRSPARTGVTVAALALVLTVGITVACLALSFRRSVHRYYGEGGFLVGDLVVSAVATEGGWLETPLPPELVDEIAAVPGVQAVEVVRAVPGQLYRGERVALLGLSEGFLDPSRYGPHWYAEGDYALAARALRAGEGVNVSVSLAERFGLRIGDDMQLDTPTGRLTLAVVGVVHDYMSDRGTIVLSRRLLVERWREPTVHRLNAVLAPGASIEVVRRALQERLGGRYRLKVLDRREILAYQDAAIRRAFAFTDAIQLLIIIVTVAGIFDLLLAAISERRRELALWRVIGADDGVVRRSIVIESATIGGLGAILGVAVGLVTAWIWIGVNFRYLLGFYLEYHFSLGTIAWYVTLVLAMTMLAGYAASRQAMRQSVLHGIRLD